VVNVAETASRSRRTVYAAIAVLLGIGLTLLADRMLGLVIPRAASADEASSAGFIFPPNTRMHHATAEFDYTAQINRFGFRDRDLAVPKDPRTFRVAVIGDSFVYGWGVDDPETWPKVLERNLRAAGLPVEVANLGAPGSDPMGYAQIAERAVPVLQPDLVIVGVLSGQDYGQLWWSTQTTRERLGHLSARELPTLVKAKVKRIVVPILSRLYPNSTGLIQSQVARRMRHASTIDAAISPEQAQEATRQEARYVEDQLTGTERARLEALDPMIKSMFRQGQLNPSLLYYALKRPDYMELTRDFHTARGRRVIKRMAQALSRVRAVADANGAKVIVVSTPYGPYVNEYTCAAIRRVGYQCEADLYTSNVADQAVEAAAKQARVPVRQVTAGIRDAAARTPLYFELDSHFNRAGYKAFADLLTPAVASEIRREIYGN
jgi:lysophospholipase L1-like esterase